MHFYDSIYSSNPYTAGLISISSSFTLTSFSIMAEIMKLIWLEKRIHKNNNRTFRLNTFHTCGRFSVAWNWFRMHEYSTFIAFFFSMIELNELIYIMRRQWKFRSFFLLILMKIVYLNRTFLLMHLFFIIACAWFLMSCQCHWMNHFAAKSAFFFLFEMLIKMNFQCVFSIK